jgi:methylisocitrate lyase
MNQGYKFRQAVAENPPLQIVGTINAYQAVMAQKTGVKAIYLSGGGVAASSLGVPDLGITTLNDVLIDVERITNVCELPLLVDIDTGFGSKLNINRTIKALIRAQAAACHIEDQVQAKRCGHRPNKQIVPIAEMNERIKACVDARTDNNFVIMARTDAIAKEGLERAIERMLAYIENGADMIFAEAVTDLSMYKTIKAAVNCPILANITEFGLTPLYTRDELASVGVDMILYPLSAFRAMNKAALNVYNSIVSNGSQKDILTTMQTREELYQYLDYYSYEAMLDEEQQ